MLSPSTHCFELLSAVFCHLVSLAQFQRQSFFKFGFFFVLIADGNDAYNEYSREDFSFRNQPIAQGVDALDREAPSLSKLGSNSTTELHPKAGAGGELKPAAMPPTSVMTRLILIMVWRKLIRNPNTYSSLLGLIWSLVSFRLSSMNDKPSSFKLQYIFICKRLNG